ncbi:hypothetical protein EUX98_g3531 [Antrodiella citrinella]|uniref:Uncharacterized protein n=1 Tax=Antrodiella citrinella TaxID=2447956 RepID=A0A4S4N4G6_9APHY|nr:hypothetical protein EUX98_g3531 [Antrodiella citrinella]
MSRLDQAAVRKICSKTETIDVALNLLNVAKLKTKAGSGFDIGQSTSGLPAICAYIASLKLKNGDVTKSNAQVASCLASKVFNAALAKVQDALDTESKRDTKATSRARGSGKLSYENFVERFGWTNPDFIVGCMKDVEQTLADSKDLKGRLAPPNTIVTVAVIKWVCEVLVIRNVRLVDIQAEHSVSDKDLKAVLVAIDTTCDVVEREILLKRKELAANKKRMKGAVAPVASSSKSRPSAVPRQASQSPIKSPAKLPSRSPSKSVLKAPSVECSPSKTPTHKRKVIFSAEAEDTDDFDGSELDTPSRKKRKVADAFPTVVFPSSAKRLPALNLTPGRGLTASSSRTTLDEIPESAAESSEALPDSDHEETIMQVDLPVVSTTATPAPSTPRRPRKSTSQAQLPATPSDYYGTPSRRNKTMTPSKAVTDNEDEFVMPRRHRPILLGYKQWFEVDPRLKRELSLAESAKAILVGKHGHPFEHLKQVAVEAGCA